MGEIEQVVEGLKGRRRGLKGWWYAMKVLEWVEVVER